MKQCPSALPLDILMDVERVVTLAHVNRGDASTKACEIITRIESHTGLSSRFEGIILPTTMAPEVPTGEPGWSTQPPAP